MLDLPDAILLGIHEGISRRDAGCPAVSVHHRENVEPHIHRSVAAEVDGSLSDFAARKTLQEVYEVVFDRRRIFPWDVGYGRQQHGIRPIHRRDFGGVEGGESEIPAAEQVRDLRLLGIDAGRRRGIHLCGLRRRCCAGRKPDRQGEQCRCDEAL